MTRGTRTAKLDHLALRGIFVGGAAWLGSQVEVINALNVFPVPDGDTGTNMCLTMREALETASREKAPTASALTAAMAHGALMGAKGNSGVILSQILAGFGRAAEGKDCLAAPDLVHAFEQAARLAYKAVGQPVEGTMLTVIREVAEALAAAHPPDPLAILEVAQATAVASVARTPLRLAVLRENGVVDAGAQGLATLLEGMFHTLKGDAQPPATATVAEAHFARAAHADGDHGYGFCTEFFIERSTVGVETIRANLSHMARSLLVAGEPSLVKVHLHTLEPEKVLTHAGSFGTVQRVKIENMDAQHQEYRAKGQAAAVGKTGVVAVVAGAGMESLFRNFGATAIVSGGQTMNPSVEEILRGIASVPQADVILIPNNENVALAAEQAARIATGKKVRILPTRDLPQGICAMIAFNYEADTEGNLHGMKQACASVKTGEVTNAMRHAQFGGARIEQGQSMGLSNGNLMTVRECPGDALLALIERLGVEEGSAVSIYYGADTSPAAAEEAGERVRKRFPDAETRVYFGGQPHYQYLVSVE